jgi:hypothetical protein
MNETDTHGFVGVRSGDRVTFSSTLGGGFKADATDPNLRDRLIEFIEERAEELAESMLEELSLDNQDAEDYDALDPRGDLD